MSSIRDSREPSPTHEGEKEHHRFVRNMGLMPANACCFGHPGATAEGRKDASDWLRAVTHR